MLAELTINYQPKSVKMTEPPELLEKIAAKYYDKEGQEVEVYQKRRGFDYPIITWGNKSLSLNDINALWKIQKGYHIFGIKKFGQVWVLTIYADFYSIVSLKDFIEKVESFLMKTFEVKTLEIEDDFEI